MAYGMGFREQELVFPTLMSDTQIDEQFTAKLAAAEETKFKPIDVIRKKLPQVADRMELLWGGSGFDKYVSMIMVDPQGKPVKLPADVLKAILALQTFHKQGNGIPGPISSWLPDTIAKR